MQEKVGYIYIITNDCFKDNIVKIGKTSKTPDERCAELYSGILEGDPERNCGSIQQGTEGVCQTG